MQSSEIRLNEKMKSQYSIVLANGIKKIVLFQLKKHTNEIDVHLSQSSVYVKISLFHRLYNGVGTFLG